MFWQPAVEAGDFPVVRASYDVSARGRPSNLEVELVAGEEDTSLSRFRRRLGSTLFRPRWISGEAEAVSGLSREYRLLK